MASFTIVVLASAVILSFLIQKLRNKRNSNLPPAPKGLPLIGNLHQFDSSTSHFQFWQLSKKYGALMSLKFGSAQVLVVSSSKMAKQIMKTHHLKFSNRPTNLALQRFSYDGLDLAFAPCNSYSIEMKKICMVHLLSSSRVKSFRPIREFEVLQVLEKISKLAVASKSIDLSECLISLAIDIICRVGFGKKYDEHEKQKLQELLRETEHLFTSLFVSDYFVFGRFIDKLSGLMHRLEKNFKELDNFLDNIIQEHLHSTTSNAHKQEDIIDILLQILKDGSSKVDLTLNHIKAVLMNILTGASDTIPATVIWVMTYLMKNPLVMDKVQEEIRSIVGNKGFVYEDDIVNLTYLKFVIKETLRMQPPILLIPRESSEHCNLEGYQIPPKTQIFVNLWAIGRDPEVWENPEEFCPERFMGETVNFYGKNFELIPFGSGRRACPGISMGLATVELCLANLLYKFDWKMPIGLMKEDLDLETLPGITRHKKNPLCLMARIYT
uniref:Cytochrome p450 n=1 Tax=Croton stellatopilosus TaxID=431156 RepID=A0A3G2CJX7_9ROSI|nr:cytochrome p450 [Croton stellatopilosus]